MIQSFDNVPINPDGPNMGDYEEAARTYAIEVPEHFNFAFDVVDRWSEDRTKLALVWADRTGRDICKYSFFDLKALSSRFANALIELGFEKGDRLFVMVPRVVDWYAVMLGCCKLGVIPMPAPNILTPKDVAYRIREAEAAGALVWHEHLSTVEQARRECPSLRHLVRLGGEGTAGPAGWLSYESLMEQASTRLSREDVAATRSDDIMLIYFTSGTTKFPKMVPHTQASYGLGHMVTAKFWHDLKPTDLHWTLADTGWAKAAWGKLFGQWLVGAAVMVHDASGKFDAKAHLELIERCGITTLCAPPTAFRMFVLEDLTRYDFSQLRHCCSAGEPLNPEVIKVWKEHTGVTIYDGFGQTETVNIIANYPCMPVKFGSMGRPAPGFVVEIVDDQGHVLPSGQEGHIAIRVKPAPPVGLFTGYWRNPEATAESFQGDWYYTGDKGYKDEDGYFWFVGRADDVINSAGYRIGPFEVESALQSHPAVAESAAVASPDPLRGTIVKAFIILAPGYDPSEELKKEIQEHVKQETAPYKYPREIEFVGELPKTLSGKIRRVELRRLEEERKDKGQR
jgi:acetyl-CoA synthetase